MSRMSRRDKEFIEEGLRQAGDTEERRSDAERFSANINFFRSNRTFLLGKYPDKFVAIQDEQVVAVSRNMEGLMRQIKRKGIERRGLYAQFLDPDPKPRILMRTGQSVRFLLV